MISSNQIESFFRAPPEGDPSGNRRSVLFVLRRDLCKLYGPEDVQGSAALIAPILAAGGMMTGIDLLTKLHTGKIDEPLAGASDFEAFLSRFGEVSTDHAAALYQYRCAQAHSYGFTGISRRAGERKKFLFTLSDSPAEREVVLAFPENHYAICFWPLKLLFRRMIGAFHRRLTDPAISSQEIDAFYRASTEIGFMEVTQ